MSLLRVAGILVIRTMPTQSSQHSQIRGSRRGHRYAAAMVDNLIGIVAAYMAPVLLPISNRLIVGLSMYAFYLLYFGTSEALFARTLGKYWFGFKVVDERGDKCRPRQALLRTVGRILDANPLFLGALPAALMVWFTSRRQHLGDFMAKTYVVEDR